MCFSSPCILANLPRLATGTKRTRLRLKQLFVLSFASPGGTADARGKAAFETFFKSDIVAKFQTTLLLNRSAPFTPQEGELEGAF